MYGQPTAWVDQEGVDVVEVFVRVALVLSMGPRVGPVGWTLATELINELIGRRRASGIYRGPLAKRLLEKERPKPAGIEKTRRF